MTDLICKYLKRNMLARTSALERSISLNVVGIIPARMGSSRFYGKPIAKILGLPMLEHVYRRSFSSKSLNDLYVATCDEEIRRAVESFGGKVVMTKASHERASDRVAEAMVKIEEEKKERIGAVVMIQGDEPMLFPEMVDASAGPVLTDENIHVTNLMAPIKIKEDQDDPNTVKVVVDKNHFAMYFSREPIPSWKKGAQTVPMFKQVCVITFRREHLLKFNNLPPTPLEIVESVDMLRLLENNLPVKMVLTEFDTYSVDTMEDLKKVEQLMERSQRHGGVTLKNL